MLKAAIVSFLIVTLSGCAWLQSLGVISVECENDQTRCWGNTSQICVEGFWEVDENCGKLQPGKWWCCAAMDYACTPAIVCEEVSK